MSARIKNTIYAKTANDGSTIYVLANIDCDTSADLPGTNDFSGITLVMGSTAHDIEQNALYEMQSGGTWVLQEPGAAAYTKSETDALLDAKLSKTDIYRGAEILQNDDLNLYLTFGAYYCNNSAIAATLLNCPTTASGFLMQIYSNGGNRFQLIYPISSTGNKIYFRAYTGSTWRQWYAIEGAAN